MIVTRSTRPQDNFERLRAWRQRQEASTSATTMSERLVALSGAIRTFVWASLLVLLFAFAGLILAALTSLPDEPVNRPCGNTVELSARVRPCGLRP